jgi:hypothetical protein
MDFLLVIERSEDVNDIDFIRINIEKPLEKVLISKNYNLKEYWFNFRIVSKKFQNFFDHECNINKKSKRFIYSYEMDSAYFNQLTDEEALKLLCSEINISLNKFEELKPKSYKQDDFIDDVRKVIEKWL